MNTAQQCDIRSKYKCRDGISTIYNIYSIYIIYVIILRKDLWNLDIGVCVGDCEWTREVGNLYCIVTIYLKSQYLCIERRQKLTKLMFFIRFFMCVFYNDGNDAKKMRGTDRKAANWAWPSSTYTIYSICFKYDICCI